MLRRLILNRRDVGFGCRYELREDRKRTELQTAGHVESLRRDILRFVGSVPPPPVAANSVSSVSATAAVYPPFTGGGGGGGGSSRHGHRSATASRHSSVERDVVGGGEGESPATSRTCTNCGAGSGYPTGIGGGAASAAAAAGGTNLDAIKREIAIGLRAEIRELVREVALVATGGGRNAALAAMASPASVAGAGAGGGSGVVPGSRSAPPRLSTPLRLPASASASALVGADLYQTHLYTQL